MDGRACWRLLAQRTPAPLARGTARPPSGESVEQTGPTEDERESLDVALLSYRSDPYSGGQGVYVKYLSRALVDRGHSVDVISGRPYPDLAPDVNLVRLPVENVVDEEDRFGAFELDYLRDPVKLFEWASVLTGGFPEPYAFGQRVVEYFAKTDPDYDVVHDNQSLCYGLLDLVDMGVPVVATVHHPITVDRDLALQHAEDRTERLFVRRWYRFLAMQRYVVERLPHVIAVSEASQRRTVEDFGASPDAVTVVHNGIDTDLFAPRDGALATDVPTARPVADGGDPGTHRIVTTVSADTPLKGAPYLLRAFAEIRDGLGSDRTETGTDTPGASPDSSPAATTGRDVELIVVGEFDEGGTADRLASDLGIEDAITNHSGISDAALVDLYASASVAVVPSLYEGFGFPAGEAMACGVPLVATSGGALPEVVGDAGVVVPSGDAGALADAIVDLLDDPGRRERLGDRGRRRVRAEFDWDETARETVREYRRAIAHADG